ncbi:hypothetical protein BDW67DRAFT_167870 [Aspergillus spinulosporus]
MLLHCYPRRPHTLILRRLMFRELHIAALGNRSSSAIEVLTRITTKIYVGCEGRL